MYAVARSRSNGEPLGVGVTRLEALEDAKSRDPSVAWKDLYFDRIYSEEDREFLVRQMDR